VHSSRSRAAGAWPGRKGGHLKALGIVDPRRHAAGREGRVDERQIPVRAQPPAPPALLLGPVARADKVRRPAEAAGGLAAGGAGGGGGAGDSFASEGAQSGACGRGAWASARSKRGTPLREEEARAVAQAAAAPPRTAAARTQDQDHREQGSQAAHAPHCVSHCRVVHTNSHELTRTAHRVVRGEQV